MSSDAVRSRQLARFRRLQESDLSPYFANLEPISNWEQFQTIPFTTKTTLAQQLPEALISGTPVRMHQTSGTSTGTPLRWFDTRASWDWILNCWTSHFELMGITPADRAFFAFSFGPFLGFWSSFEAAGRNDILAFAGGGMSSTARLKFILEHHATVVFCTPTYAVHLAEVAAKEKLDLPGSAVRALVLAGEPGAAVPAIRARIESAWGARAFDHYGLTEVGPVASEAIDSPGNLVILEEHFIAEVIEPGGTQPVADGEVGELVLTNLGRVGSPNIRYRTGDMVRKQGNQLVGGILGRADDMIHIRGNNVYPSAIEAVIFRQPDVAEFQIHLDKVNPLVDLRIVVEPRTVSSEDKLKQIIERSIRDELLFRAEVTLVPPGTLPRSEMKSRRVMKDQ